MADLESFKLPSSKEVVQKLRWRLAVLIQLVAAKPDQVDKVVDTFLATYRHVQEIWTALKHNDSPLAFTFDTAADGSRDVNELLQSSLVMQSVRTMKTHTKVTIPNTEKTAGVPVGLVIFFKAKPGKAGAVRELVFSTIFSFIKEGEGTLIWFGLEYPDIPGLFGILDFFTDEEGRTLQRRYGLQLTSCWLNLPLLQKLVSLQQRLWCKSREDIHWRAYERMIRKSQ